MLTFVKSSVISVISGVYSDSGESTWPDTVGGWHLKVFDTVKNFEKWEKINFNFSYLYVEYILFLYKETAVSTKKKNKRFENILFYYVMLLDQIGRWVVSAVKVNICEISRLVYPFCNPVKKTSFIDRVNWQLRSYQNLRNLRYTIVKFHIYFIRFCMFKKTDKFLFVMSVLVLTKLIFYSLITIAYQHKIKL